VLRTGISKSKISGTAKEATSAYNANTGWQAIYYPKGGQILVNVPVSSTRYDQHVLNVITGAWTTFRDIPARCWMIYDNDLYFGGDGGVVFKADNGNDDNGTAISGDVTQAFNDFGIKTNKRITAYRPVLEAEGTLTFESGVSFDFQTTNVTETLTQLSDGAEWDVAEWDVAEWAPSLSLKQDWRMSDGMGYQAAIRLRLQASGQNVFWHRTDYLYEIGSPI
jgi:hypothetical protein